MPKNSNIEEIYKNRNMEYFNSVRMEILPLIKGKNLNIFEVGCGTGATLAYLKEQGIANKIIGNEIDLNMANIAQKYLDSVMTGNIEETKIDSKYKNYFDVILCLDVLEHMIDPWTLMDNLKQYLTPQGYFIVSIPNIRYKNVLRKLVLNGEWNYTESETLDKGHLRFFTKKSLYDLAEGIGFTVSQTNNTEKYENLRDYLLKVLSFNKFRDIFTYQYIARLDKLDK